MAGNPQAKRRGQEVRAIILATARPAARLDAVMARTNLSRCAILWHLAELQLRREIRGYSTRGGVVRVW